MIRGAKVYLLLLIVGLILWAKHAGLFVASFCESFIFDELACLGMLSLS